MSTIRLGDAPPPGFFDGAVEDPTPYDEEPECDCLDYEADILTGIATCTDCGHRWHQTAAEIERERQNQIEYDQMCAEWEREQRSLRNRFRGLIIRVRSWFAKPLPDDEIPF